MPVQELKALRRLARAPVGSRRPAAGRAAGGRAALPPAGRARAHAGGGAVGEGNEDARGRARARGERAARRHRAVAGALEDLPVGGRVCSANVSDVLVEGVQRPVLGMQQMVAKNAGIVCLFVDSFLFKHPVLSSITAEASCNNLMEVFLAVQVNMLVDEEGVSLQKYFPILK